MMEAHTSAEDSSVKKINHISPLSTNNLLKSRRFILEESPSLICLLKALINRLL